MAAVIDRSDPTSGRSRTFAALERCRDGFMAEMAQVVDRAVADVVAEGNARVAEALAEGAATANELRAECERLRKLCEAEAAERARLAAALQAVRTAIGAVDPSPTEPVADSETLVEDHSAPEGDAAPNPKATERNLVLVPPARSPLPTTIEQSDGPDSLTAYVKHLLEDIQMMYWADVRAQRPFGEVVERLTASLHYAHSLFGARAESEPAGAAVFADCVSALLGTSAEPFSRHLAIAAYNLPEPVPRQPAHAEAS